LKEIVIGLAPKNLFDPAGEAALHWHGWARLSTVENAAGPAVTASDTALSKNCHASVLEESANRNIQVREGPATMKSGLGISAIAVAVSLGWASPALAGDKEDAALREELAVMRAQMAKLAERVDTLEGQLDSAKARAESAEVRASAALAQAEAVKADLAKPVKPAEPAFAVNWKGAPELSTKDGWSFKPRGRLHIDAGTISSPGGNTRVRRARLGAEGTIPGGLGYKVEVDFANGAVALADTFVTYSPGNAPIVLRVGNFETLNGLEQITSSNFNSLIERASFNDAFLNSRRLGASLSFKGKNDDWRAEVAAFSAHAPYSSPDNDGWIGAARLTYMPKALGGQLHFGVNYQYRDFASNISGGTSVGTNMPSVNQLARYRARPGSQLTDVRFVDTGNFAASGDSILGIEAAGIFKSLHFASEAQWLKARGYRAGSIAIGSDAFSGGNAAVVPVSNPGFFGAYGELGYFLTGETRGYKRGDGTWARTKVLNPISKGGLGAIQVVARYEYLDLADDDLVGGPTNNFANGTSALAALNSRLGRGGTQSSYILGLNWHLNDYLRLMLNYGRVEVEGGPIAVLVDPASTLPVNQRGYGVNVLQSRLQFDF
jgi:phosphate-selective porin OprO and OprP